VTVGSCSEIHRERAFTDRGWGPEKPLPGAQELGATGMVFLVHPTLTLAFLDEVVDIVRTVVHQATA
jgi:dTDP-4-amino-4,6-dideoxygalactose transaminase